MNFHDSIQTDFEKVALELIKKSIQFRVSQSFLEGVQYNEIRNISSKIVDSLIYELRYNIFGIKRKIKKEIKRPTDWWNAVKERFFPKWLLKKFPVKYETIPVDVEVTKVCPHLNIETEYQDHIAWIASGHEHESDWRYDKSVPMYLKETIRLLEAGAYFLENDHQMVSHEMMEQVEKLKEIL